MTSLACLSGGRTARRPPHHMPAPKGLMMTTRPSTPAKRGRPSAGRTALLRLRLSPAELQRYQAAADDLGVPLSEWVREACEAFASDDPAVHPSARKLASGDRGRR